jgi:hypothetical protein
LNGSGTQFDPDVVQAFLNRENELMEVMGQLQDQPANRDVRSESGTELEPVAAH